MSGVTRQLTLGIESGLHLSPIGRIVQSLSDLDCDVRIEFAGRSADARSVTDLMLLAATVGAPMTVQAEGAQAEEAVERVAEILENPEPPHETPGQPR